MDMCGVRTLFEEEYDAVWNVDYCHSLAIVSHFTVRFEKRSDEARRSPRVQCRRFLFRAD